MIIKRIQWVSCPLRGWGGGEEVYQKYADIWNDGVNGSNHGHKHLPSSSNTLGNVLLKTPSVSYATGSYSPVESPRRRQAMRPGLSFCIALRAQHIVEHMVTLNWGSRTKASSHEFITESLERLIACHLLPGAFRLDSH